MTELGHLGLRECLELAKQDLGIRSLAPAGQHDLERLLPDRAGGEVLLADLVLGLRLLLGLGAELGGIFLSLLALFRPSRLVLLDLLLDNGGTFEPARTSLELALLAGIGVAEAGVIVPVGGGVRVVLIVIGAGVIRVLWR